MNRILRFGTALSVAACAFAQLPTTIRVSSETVPPGGMAQMKVLLTSPQPISSGTVGANLDAPFLDDINGIAMFSPTGDVSGAAVVNGHQIKLRLHSPNRTFGTVEYPMLTVAIAVSPHALPGQTAPISIDPGVSGWLGPNGQQLAIELAAGSVTVGGSVSINNVLPGGGTIPAGTVVRILGVGFSDKTKLRVSNAKVVSLNAVSPTEMHVRFRDAETLDGAAFHVANPDGSSDTYYSYLRGVPVGQSLQPLLAHTVPVFSTNTSLEAVLPPTVSAVNANFATGLAIQNPGPSASDVRLDLYNAAHQLTGRARISLDAGTRITRELGEWFGVAPTLGSVVHIVASEPVQTLGLLANRTDSSVAPVDLRAITPGTFRP